MGLSTAGHNLRLTWRTLMRQRLSSLMIVAVLAVGSAGITAIFNLFNGLFLHPFPVPDQERLVDLNQTSVKSRGEHIGLTYSAFDAWRQHNKSFDCMAARIFCWSNLCIDGVAVRVHGLRATPGLFDVLDVHPVLGRRFTAEEDRPGGPHVLLLSFGFWERLFSRDPQVLGRTLRLDNELFTIIGVLPAESVFPDQRDVWMPLQAEPGKDFDIGSGGVGIGRLRKGVTVEQALDDLAGIHQGWLEKHADRGRTIPTVVDWRARYLGQYRTGTVILLGVAAFLLLIACINVSGITLARWMRRSREVTTCVVLGATWRHIVQQVLAESLVLAVIGGALGTILGRYALTALLSPMADVVPAWMHFGLDVRCLLFCALIVGVVVVLSGGGPALYAAFPKHLHGKLQAMSRRTTISRAGRKVLNAIVIVEISLALTLSVGAALLLRSFREVQNIDLGFSTANLLTYHIPLTGGLYSDEHQRRAFWEQHLQQVQALPGVLRATLSSTLPFAMQQYDHFEVEGMPSKDPGDPDDPVLSQSVMPGYFETVGTPLAIGRSFLVNDTGPGREPVVIVNDAFAKRFWPNSGPVNKRIRCRDSGVWMRVVGVTKNVQDPTLNGRIMPTVYLPVDLGGRGAMYGVVRVSGNPLSYTPLIRTIVQVVDATVPVEQVQTMSQRVDQAMLLRRVFLWLFGVPAAAAVVMALAGIYGVISYSVAHRIQEIGIRMALGARTSDVTKMVMRQGMRLVLVALGIGLAGSFILGRLLGSIPGLLYKISPTDPVALGGTASFLVAISSIIVCGLASRAAKADIMEALRSE